MNANRKSLEARVLAAAEAALKARHVVSALDILVGIGWLEQSSLEAWRRGQVPYLERSISANLHKISDAMHFFRSWAIRRGLKPSETVYVARTRDRRRLRFSKSGDEAIERGYRTHWVSPELSEAKRQRLHDRESRPPDLVVIQPLKDWTCRECSGAGSFLIMEDEGPLCLTCADLDHLVYLPAGNMALTRRAKKGSRLSAVVVRFSRARKRYERQGVLVEADALANAEAECLADSELRDARRHRDQERRAKEDESLEVDMAQEILRLFPGCPPERAGQIASHTGARGTGRIGRTAAGRALDEEAVTLAVIASVRHGDTTYDDLLMTGVPRLHARARVRDEVERRLREWRKGAAGTSSQT